MYEVVTYAGPDMGEGDAAAWVVRVWRRFLGLSCAAGVLCVRSGWSENKSVWASNWEFAIFKWSTERYDPDEWFFPGAEYVDGTVEGAMMAGLHAYPV
jgi:hypothetical protein